MTPAPPPTLSADWLGQVSFRRLSKNDLPALEWEGEYRHFRRLYVDIYRGYCQGRVIMWVADLPDAGVIGQMFVQLVSPRTELADGATRAYIYGFRIKQRYRGYGLGTRFLQAVEADLIRRRFSSVCLNVSRENLDAQRLYQRLGYQVVAAEPGRWSYIDDHGRRQEVNEPAWRMEKRLD